jgi:dUTP pyrophosphatase
MMSSTKKKNNQIPAKIIPDDPMFIPMYKTKGSTCMDLVANIPPQHDGKQEIRFLPGHLIKIDCGFKMALDEGWEAQIRCRSGLAERGIQVTNGIGSIDSDYRGRIAVLLNNAGKEIVVLKHGDRIAQMAIVPAYQCVWQIVKELDVTERNEGGFGSTGSGA